MVALAGGDDIKCAEYATFGTEELSKNISNHKKEIKKLNISLSTGDTISVKLISTNTFNGNLFFEYQQLLKRFMVDKKLRT